MKKWILLIALLLFSCESSDSERCEVYTSETTGHTYIECPNGNSYENYAGFQVGEEVYVTTTIEKAEE
jgi:hypothetical protein